MKCWNSPGIRSWVQQFLRQALCPLDHHCITLQRMQPEENSSECQKPEAQSRKIRVLDRSAEIAIVQKCCKWPSRDIGQKSASFYRDVEATLIDCRLIQSTCKILEVSNIINPTQTWPTYPKSTSFDLPISSMNHSWRCFISLVSLTDTSATRIRTQVGMSWFRFSGSSSEAPLNKAPVPVPL